MDVVSPVRQFAKFYSYTLLSKSIVALTFIMSWQQMLRCVVFVSHNEKMLFLSLSVVVVK